MSTKKVVLDESQGLGVEGFLARYTPTSLTAEQWKEWREPVMDLVVKLGPASRNAATVAAGALCEAIAASGAEPGTSLIQVLRGEVINRVADGRRRSGRSDQYARDGLTQLRRLQSVALGFSPRPELPRNARVVGSAPSLAALRTLAHHEDEFIRTVASQILGELSTLRPQRWDLPVSKSVWSEFRSSPPVRQVIGSLRWSKLRGERVWEEMHNPTPPVQLISYLRYANSHWDRLTLSARPDVHTDIEVFRGCNMDRSRHWTVKDAPLNPSKPVITRRTSSNRSRSKAEARRIAQEYIQNLQSEPEPLSDSLEGLLEAWVPKGMPTRDWLACKDLVHEVMRRTHIRGEESFRKYLRILADYISWAVKAGYPEDILPLMTDDAINDYARTVLATSSDATAGTKRSKLRILARTVNPEENVQATKLQFQHSDVKPPYTNEDVYWITQRISLVRSLTTRRALQTAIALGLGAGLSTGDLQTLTRGNIDDRGKDGICITVTGRNSRTVWMRYEFEEMLREGIAHLSPNGRILGLRHHKDTVRDLYRHIQPTGAGPSVVQSRLRHTWLAHLMCEPIPLITLLRVAGLSTARTLTELSPYLHENIDEQALRGVA